MSEPDAGAIADLIEAAHAVHLGHRYGLLGADVLAGGAR